MLVNITLLIKITLKSFHVINTKIIIYKILIKIFRDYELSYYNRNYGVFNIFESQ